MPGKQEHRQEVRSYLQQHLTARPVKFSPPGGTGMETYFVQAGDQRYFVKVGAPVERYLAMAEIGLSPPILSFGQLESGTSIFVQAFLRGRMPGRPDFQNHWENIARLVLVMHNHPHLRDVLPPADSQSHKDAASRALRQLVQRWECYRDQVPNEAAFVEKSLERLSLQIAQFSGKDLAACHGDICNGNWLFSSDGRINILDLESMALDDPALDLGALLWWYYPPEMRKRFLDLAGYPYDEDFRERMRVRMALHCLSITLPREHGFEEFHPDQYHGALIDFRAIMEGKENPQGYAA